VSLPLTPSFLFFLGGVVLIAGTVNGLAGFGFAVVATMALATVVEPATAVVFMIIPILAVNLSLVRELSGPQLRTCGRRFGPLLGGALVGMIAGMAVLDSLPQAPLRGGLGVVTLAFVATAQRVVPLPTLTGATDGGLRENRAAMASIGAVSGVLFGGTNVGVQLVAYLKSFDLSHGLFVGVVAMLFVGLNGVRVVAAGALGLYPNPTVLALSAVAAVPAAIGVVAGRRLRTAVTERQRRGAVLGLLAFIGVRLLIGGLGVP